MQASHDGVREATSVTNSIAKPPRKLFLGGGYLHGLLPESVAQTRITGRSRLPGVFLARWLHDTGAKPVHRNAVADHSTQLFIVETTATVVGGQCWFCPGSLHLHGYRYLNLHLHLSLSRSLSISVCRYLSFIINVACNKVTLIFGERHETH